MRRIAIAGSLTAALALASQPANAEGILFARHPKVDQRVAAVGLGAGIVGTVTYFSLAHRNGQHGLNWGVWGATTVGCLVLSPMIAAAVVRERELTSREVAVMEGSCIIPIVGGMLINAIYDANPQWEASETRTVKVVRKSKKVENVNSFRSSPRKRGPSS
jgi:hypothetical protein